MGLQGKEATRTFQHVASEIGAYEAEEVSVALPPCQGCHVVVVTACAVHVLCVCVCLDWYRLVWSTCYATSTTRQCHTLRRRYVCNQNLRPLRPSPLPRFLRRH